MSDSRRFGTLKDGSLLINIHASNHYFSIRNIFQNGVDALSKIDDALLTRPEKVMLFVLSDNVQISLACGYTSDRLLMSSIATITRYNPLQHQLFYTDFPFKLFLYSFLPTILILSLQNLNKIGRSELYKILIF